jgi:hypothetical protein
MGTRVFLPRASATVSCLVVLSVSAPPTLRAQSQPSSAVERGKYLVTVGGCHDCHTPKTMTSRGPEPDMTRSLSGHPSSVPIPAVPAGVLGPGKWGAVATADLTAWYGPWGASFAANLTSDPTGLGSWTKAMFIRAMRTGKHQGVGRPILPPMPWQNYSQMTDGDLGAVFDYLRTLKTVKNAVPAPIPPTARPAR